MHLFDPQAPYRPPEPERSRYPSGYDGEIAYTDRVVGNLVDAWEARRGRDQTLVIVTANHGESLGEHDEATHGVFIHDATIRVPLVIRAPGLRLGAPIVAPVSIIFAEGADGLTREENIRLGKKYKDGTINTRAKNDSVLAGLPRLLDTFRRAKANYESGYAIPQTLYPPSNFNVQGGGDKIAMSWNPSPLEGANGFVGYRLYREMARVDSTYRLIFQAGGPAPTDPSVAYSPTKAYSFDDVTAIRGVNYYYYVTSFGDPSANTGVGNTPPGSLETSTSFAGGPPLWSSPARSC